MINIQNIPENISNEHLKYANTLSNNDNENIYKWYVVHAEFIKWEDSPKTWETVWENDTVFCTITDFSLLKNKSLGEIIQEDKRHSKYNTQYIPQNYQNKVKRKTEIKTFKSGKKYNYSNIYLTQTEYDEFWNIMDDMTRKEWLETQNKKFNDDISKIYGYPSIEFPIKIQLYGTNKCSYSFCVKDKETAFNIVNKIKSNPTWNDINNIGFVFTN